MPVYKSAQGRPIDMTQLASKHEKVRAIGNMNVNARGDVIDSNNKITKDNTKRVKNTYSKTVTNDAPMVHKPTPNIEEPIELSLEEQELFNDTDEDIKK